MVIARNGGIGDGVPVLGRRRAFGGGVVLTVAAVLTISGVSDAAVVSLLEAPTCARPAAVVSSTSPAVAPGSTRVSFRVPALTRLRVSGTRVVAAATNTGCTPRGTDTFVTGTRRSTAAEVRSALGTAWSGDWTTPGTWHRAR